MKNDTLSTSGSTRAAASRKKRKSADAPNDFHALTEELAKLYNSGELTKAKELEERYGSAENALAHLRTLRAGRWTERAMRIIYEPTSNRREDADVLLAMLRVFEAYGVPRVTGINLISESEALEDVHDATTLSDRLLAAFGAPRAYREQPLRIQRHVDVLRCSAGDLMERRRFLEALGFRPTHNPPLYAAPITLDRLPEKQKSKLDAALAEALAPYAQILEAETNQLIRVIHENIDGTLQNIQEVLAGSGEETVVPNDLHPSQEDPLRMALDEQGAASRNRAAGESFEALRHALGCYAGFKVDDAIDWICAHPELLLPASRAAAVLELMGQELRADEETVRRNIEDPRTATALYLPPDRLRALAHGYVLGFTECGIRAWHTLDPVRSWDRFLVPARRIMDRIRFLTKCQEEGLRILADEETAHAIYFESDEDLTSLIERQMEI